MRVKERLTRAAAAALMLAALTAGPVLAQSATDTNSTGTSTPPTSGTSTPEKTKKPKHTVDLVCMQTAVAKRDDAVMAAWDAYGAAVKAALVKRKTALVDAWKLEDRKVRRETLKSAWKTWRAERDAARKAWAAARKSAWKQYHADRKACAGQPVTDDASTEAQDASL